MFAYALLIVLPALALTQQVDQLENELFKALDADKSNKITQAETETYFLGFDANKDGSISQAELTASVDKLDPGFVGKEATLFTLFDRNTDGKVDKADIDAVFKLADLNGDNSVDRQEFRTIFNTVLSHVG